MSIIISEQGHLVKPAPLPETLSIVAVLKALQPGETASYSALSDAAGLDVQLNMHLVRSARRMLLKDRKCFRAVSNVGIRRLSDSGAVNEAMSDRRNRIRSQARMAKREIGTVDPARLSREDLEAYDLGRTLIAIVGGAIERRIERKEVANGSLPPGLATH